MNRADDLKQKHRNEFVAVFFLCWQLVALRAQEPAP